MIAHIKSNASVTVDGDRCVWRCAACTAGAWRLDSGGLSRHLAQLAVQTIRCFAHSEQIRNAVPCLGVMPMFGKLTNHYYVEGTPVQNDCSHSGCNTSRIELYTTHCVIARTRSCCNCRLAGKRVYPRSAQSISMQGRGVVLRDAENYRNALAWPPPYYQLGIRFPAMVAVIDSGWRRAPAPQPW